MNSKNDVIKKDVLKLQSEARPPLAAGEYVLKATLETDVAGASIPESELSITVEAPRFAIDLSLIYSTYPLGGSSGAYQDSLPHLIFTSKTLPWERRIDPTDARNPWVGLLLLTEEEMDAHTVEIQTLKIEDITKGTSELLTPNLEIQEWEKALGQVRVLEMPLDLFKSIAPSPGKELPYLAHTRQVDMLDKENLEANPKGWFSVVIGNRLAQQGKINHVFLISMEGLQPAYTDTKHQRLRVILLTEWSFQCQGPTFKDLVEALAANIKPFRMEMADDSKPAADNTEIVKALKYGYCPINHQWRNGQKTLAWYRGPLVPVDTPLPDTYQYESADEALRFDESTGMFDISYAAAWQLGRLLALQQTSFSKALNDWKAVYKREWPLAIARDILKNWENPVTPEELSQKVELATSDTIVTDLLIELWNE